MKMIVDIFTLFLLMWPHYSNQAIAMYNQILYVRHPIENIHTVGDTELGFEYSPEEALKFKIWPQAVVPYFIDDFSFDKMLRDKLRLFLGKVNSFTGLQFVELPRPPDEEAERWVLFLNRRGQLSCADYNTNSFTNQGVQRVVVGYDCLSEDGGVALAPTVLALAGVPPQHNAPDRDEYIEVFTDNILPDKRHLFTALKNKDWLFHDIRYDFSSAGHYELYKYTANGSVTIKPKRPLSVVVGEADFLSYYDVLKIKLMYNFVKHLTAIANTTQCSKLYKRGKKFDEFDPSSNELKPTFKPDKYLYGEIKEQKQEEENDNAKLKYSTQSQIHRPDTQVYIPL